MPRTSDQAIRQEVEQRLKETALLKEETQNSGLRFSSVTEEQLNAKIRRESGKSPYIYAQSWTSGTTIGSFANYTVNSANRLAQRADIVTNRSCADQAGLQ